MNLNNIGEFGFIRNISKQSIFNSEELVLGIGDDAAVLPFNEDYYLLAASDMLVEGVHFLINKSDPYKIGYKSVAVNLSDIAAMGGWPSGIMISIGFPKETSLDFLEKIYQGIRDICQKYKVNIIGGDTVYNPRGLIINISVHGKVKKDKLALRSGAKVGDIVFTTGYLGDSAAGLEILLREERNKDFFYNEYLLNKHLLPEPCLEEVKFINDRVKINALNDISDGLANEAHEISYSSQVGIELYTKNIPISGAAQKLAQALKKDSLAWALFGGEDFQLVGTLSAKDYIELAEDFLQEFKRPIYKIGKVVKNKGVFLVAGPNKKPINAEGYNHFK